MNEDRRRPPPCGAGRRHLSRCSCPTTSSSRRGRNDSAMDAARHSLRQASQGRKCIEIAHINIAASAAAACHPARRRIVTTAILAASSARCCTESTVSPFSSRTISLGRNDDARRIRAISTMTTPRALSGSKPPGKRRRKLCHRRLEKGLLPDDQPLPALGRLGKIDREISLLATLQDFEFRDLANAPRRDDSSAHRMFDLDAVTISTTSPGTARLFRRTALRHIRHKRLTGRSSRAPGNLRGHRIGWRRSRPPTKSLRPRGVSTLRSMLAEWRSQCR